MERRTRIGAYGIMHVSDKILLITKKEGPYKGLLDLPGGGIEFGEDPKATLSREFFEEVGVKFSKCELIDNVAFTAHYNVMRGPFEEKIHLHHVGMLYEIIDPRIESDSSGEESCAWYEFGKLNPSQLSPIAKAGIQAFFKKNAAL